MMVVHIFGFDEEEVKRIERSGSARRIKRAWIKRGYQFQLSLYGALTSMETGESGYCRIEVLLNCPWTERIVHLIYDFFQALKPPSPYSIWIYDQARDALKQVGSYK